GDAQFANLDMSLTNGTLAVDPQFNLAITLHNPGPDPLLGIDDGLIHVGDLSLPAASLASALIASNPDPFAQNMVFTGTFSVSAVDPSQILPINVTSPQVTFTWSNLSNVGLPVVTAANTDGQQLLNYLLGPGAGASQPSLPAFNPGTVQQILLGSGSTVQTITAGAPGTGAQFLEFMFNGQGASAPISINLAPGDPASTDQGALALYDTAGNLLAFADNNPDPNHPAVESMAGNLTPGQLYVLGIYYEAATANDTFTVTVNAGAQQTAPSIGLDLATGQPTVVSDSFL